MIFSREQMLILYFNLRQMANQIINQISITALHSLLRVLKWKNSLTIIYYDFLEKHTYF